MEHEFAIRCVGAAKKTLGGRIIALSVSGPSPRFDDEHTAAYASMLSEAVGELAKYL